MANRGATWTREQRTWDLNASVYLDVYRSLGLDLPEPVASGGQTVVSP